MSKYTTGEIAKLCGVTTRTVQYYDTRGILIPSELSSGGRRLYSEEDLKRMKIICFLRELGLPINSISQLLSEDDPGSVISLLIHQQKQALGDEIKDCQTKMDKLEALEREMKSIDNFSVESIGDIAYLMENKKKLKRVHAVLLISAIPITAVELASIIIWIITGIWWPFIVYVLIAVPYSIWLSRYYFKHVAYICPQCHEIFKPAFKEAFFARHTPNTRKLTCTCCGHHGFCVETYCGDTDSFNSK